MITMCLRLCACHRRHFCWPNLWNYRLLTFVSHWSRIWNWNEVHRVNSQSGSRTERVCNTERGGLTFEMNLCFGKEVVPQTSISYKHFRIVCAGCYYRILDTLLRIRAHINCQYFIAIYFSAPITPHTHTHQISQTLSASALLHISQHWVFDFSSCQALVRAPNIYVCGVICT